MKIMVSACLLGENCKYNGGNNYNQRIVDFLQGREIIAVCPERLAGLGIPRTPIELRDGVMYDEDGNCVDEQISSAIAQILSETDADELECAILKSRSPTCGVKQIYDGSFTKTLIDGMGALARALSDRGVRLIDSEDL